MARGSNNAKDYIYDYYTVDSSVHDALVCPALQSNLLILQSYNYTYLKQASVDLKES